MFLINDTMLWDMNATAYEGNETTWSAVEYNRDKNALIYIIVVLSFYALGIAASMIIYLRRERIEMEEEQAYGDYFIFRNRSDTLKRYFLVQRTMDRLNGRNTQCIDKHVKKSKSTESMDISMTILQTSKTDHRMLKYAVGGDTVFSAAPEETIVLERSKTQKKLSRVWEESSVFQVSAADD